MTIMVVITEVAALRGIGDGWLGKKIWHAQKN